jgi:hypothetical protein
MTIYDQIMLTNPDLFKVLAVLFFAMCGAIGNVCHDRKF